MTQGFNIIMANHAIGVHVSDLFEYFYNGIKLAGGNPKFSYNRWEAGHINLLLENFENDGFTEAIYQIKLRSPTSKLCLVVTELLLDGRMNSAEHQGQTNSGRHYENNEYWEKRTANFKKLLPHFDRIICISEALFDGYKHLHNNVYYIPLAYYSPQRPLPKISDSDKDIDILFSGTLTPYRKNLLETWSQRGFRVENLSAHTPDYVRVDYCARSKIYLGLKLSSETRLLSKSRAQYVLLNEIKHVFERVQSATDLDDYLNFIPSGMDTVTYVTDCLRQGAIPPSKHDIYKNSRDININAIFKDLINFCND